MWFHLTFHSSYMKLTWGTNFMGLGSMKILAWWWNHIQRVLCLRSSLRTDCSTDINLQLMYAKRTGPEPTLNRTSHCWSSSEVHSISGEYNPVVAAPTSETDSTPLTKWEDARKFNKLNILLLQSQYILSLVLFVINNKNKFAANSEIHSSNTRNKSNFHQPRFQKFPLTTFFFIY